ncbi:hypothetical protein BDV26DRAFT_262228 [Aspergillus bertholletiae]|uniref:SnoaL-like domain-containing protein n=1 Tax=Aspergillus bertholletiae TaxID=1226010 RepID=A0A5N7B8K5_9EURO|nr:hypothetical protein BDV26DRAFT_262228 [Aspergillus bertholletiae]
MPLLRFSLVASVLLGLTCATSLPGCHHLTLTDENTQIVLQNHRQSILEDFAHIFYIEKRVTDAFHAYVTEDYIQHNPNILDGREAALAYLAPRYAAQGLVFEIHHAFVGGDYGLVHLRARAPGRNETAVMDMYRFEGLQIVEHWDVLQAVTVGINPHPFF